MGDMGLGLGLLLGMRVHGSKIAANPSVSDVTCCVKSCVGWQALLLSKHTQNIPKPLKQ